MRTITIILFSLLLHLPMMADTITGQCGDHLFWSFDTETAHMDITGSGKMNLTTYPAWTRKNITIASVSFSDSIESIASYAFDEHALTEVVVPASVKKFGKGCFENIPSLLRFTYEGEGYADTENGILRNCYNLRYFKGITRMMSYNDAIDTIIVTYGYAVVSYFQPTYIDNSRAYDTRLYGEYDERPKHLRTFIFPDELEIIGDFFLYNAPELGGTVIPAPVTSIGKGAFLNCSSLDSLVFRGDAIETIGDSAFCQCTNLQYIRLQDSIPPTISEHTFFGVDRSIPVYIPLNATERYKSAPYWSEFFNFIEPTPATALEEVFSHPSESSSSADFIGQKVLKDGQVSILYHDALYTIMGQRR